MKTATKVWLVIATSLVLIGCIIWGGVMTMLQWDFTKLSTVQYETNEHEIIEAFQHISISADTANIVFVPSENETASVICHEQENMKHNVSVENDTLVIQVKDTRKWQDHIGIHFGKPKITVYLPQSEYGVLWVRSSTGDITIPREFRFKSMDISQSAGNVTCFASASDTVKIKTTTGDIHVENISAGSLELSLSTGKMTVSNVECSGDLTITASTGKTRLTDVKCKNLISNGTTGGISIKNVIATEKFHIVRNTGDVTFEHADAAEIYVKTSTGDVTGSLMTQKDFIVASSSGKIDVPNTSGIGKCQISTSTGDIILTVESYITLS